MTAEDHLNDVKVFNNNNGSHKLNQIAEFFYHIHEFNSITLTMKNYNVSIKYI